MMMDLSLTSIYPLVNSGCPNCQVNGSFAKTELAPFSADCIEHLPCMVDSVVIEFDIDLSRSIKDTFVNRSDFFPSTLNPTNRIAHYDLISMSPIFCHLLKIPAIKGIVEFNQSL